MTSSYTKNESEVINLIGAKEPTPTVSKFTSIKDNEV